MSILYSSLSYLAHGLISPVLLTHPKLRDGIKERLAIDETAALQGAPRIWFHGASAGDLLALKPTIERVAKLRPDVQPVLSTITNSGYAMGKREFPDTPLRFAPYDLPGASARAMAKVKPSILVLEYTELWPNFIQAAVESGAKVVLHNGRFSAKNVANYKRLFMLIGNLLDSFELLLMRDEEEAERAIKIGAEPSKVRVTGNTKFDNLREPGPRPASLETLFATLGWQADDFVWVWGSTHDGDEDKLKLVYESLKRQWPSLRLVIAPRYVDRAPRVASMYGGCLRSQPKPGADVVVIDTIGELFQIYSYATLVFVGGSFGKRGGQNILEPAAHGKPVTFGPHMENFADSVQVLLGRGGTQVRDPEQLHRVTQELLERPDERAKLGIMAHDAVMSVRGAADRNARILVDLLKR